MLSKDDISKLPLTCNHWGAYRVETNNGRVTDLHPFEHDQDPSPIGRGMVDVLYSENRIYAPMVRKSWLEGGPGSNNHKRGSEPFYEVSWDQIETLVAEEFKRVINEFGNEAIFGGTYGWASAGRFHHAPSQLKRFLNCLGGFTTRKDSYSLAAGEVVMPYVLGPFMKLLDQATSWSSISGNTELFVSFGGVPLRNSQINSGGLGNHSTKQGLENAFRSGTRFVNLSPIESDVLDTIHGRWIPLIPGTDVAMILSLANVLVKEGLHDKGFLANHTVGFAKFRDYVLGLSDGIDKTPEWASEITGVSSETIIHLARKMASSRTMISVSWSLTRQDHGEQPFWVATVLAAMLGQIGLPGGGIGFGYGAVNTIGEEQIVIPAKSISQKTNLLKSFIPVARISDMLLNPGKEYDYDGKKRKYPLIDLIYWAGGNPFHHHQDINKLLRAWQKPSTIIVNDWCWNTSAKHADIILPCATSLERNDFAISRSAYLFYMSKAADPPGGCKTDYEIFSGFTKKLGILDEFTEGRDESDWVEYLYNQSVSRSAEVGIELPEFATFRNKGWHSLEKIAKPLVFLQDFRTKPEENPLPTPSGKIEIFSETIQGYGYEDCQGHPTWYEPIEWLGNKSTEFPLHLISNQPEGKLHSQLDHGSHSRSLKKNGREPMMINRKNADERGIKSGDTLRIYNNRGSCLATAVVSDRIHEDVVQMSTGAWYDPEMPGLIGSMCRHGNPNVLTLDKGTSSLAQGPSAHTCLVQVEKYIGEVSKLRAFEPPDILHHG